MTQIIRRTNNVDAFNHFKSVWEQGNWDRAVEDFTERAGRTGDADFSWFLSLACRERARSASRLRDAVDDYRRALEAMGRVATLDPDLFPRDNPEKATWPDRSWAVPAYIQLLRHKGIGVPRSAAEAMGRMGCRAARALPALRDVEAGHDPFERAPGLYNPALAVANPFTRPIRQIEFGDESGLIDPIERDALRRLGEHHFVRPDGTETDYTEGLTGDLDLAADSLLSRLGDRDAGVRARAVCLLGLRRSATSEIVRAVCSVASDRNAAVRAMVCHSLADVLDSDFTLREKHLQSAAEHIAGFLGEDRSYLVRRAAAASLGRLLAVAPDDGGLRAKTIPILSDCVADKDARVGIMAIKALGELGPFAAAEIPKLKAFKFHRNDDEVEEMIVIVALLRIGAEQPEIIDRYRPRFFKMIHEGRNPQARRDGVKEVQTFPIERPLLERTLLERMWMDDDPLVRSSARSGFVKAADHEDVIRAQALDVSE